MNNTLFIRIWNLLSSNSKRIFEPYFFDNIRRWKSLKGKYKGKRAFLIANGPSLNITPLYLLKDEYTIMFNRIQLMLERLNYIPTFYMVSDEVVAPNIKEDISFFIKYSQMVFTPDRKKNGVDFTSFVPYSEKVLYWYEEPVKFSKKPPIMGPGGTVIYWAFQALAYMGFDEVVVVGNDMNYVVHKTIEVIDENIVMGKNLQSVRSKEDDDPNHFDPRYFGKGKEYHQPTEDVVNRIFSALDRVAVAYKEMGRKVTNAGYNSLVNSFPKQDFYECLGYSQDKIDQLFEELIQSKGFSSISDFLDKSTEVSTIWDGDLDIAAVPINIVDDVVKKKITDYLPLGPYNNCVYFVNRKTIHNFL